MRKRLTDSNHGLKPSNESFIHLESLAEVELSSENPEWPIENALLPNRDAGWRAASPSAQFIRIWFDQPQTIRRVYLHFSETETERTQEFALYWAQHKTETPRLIVRQQWNFSPSGATHEIEDFSVQLEDAVLLQLDINPSINNSNSYASLTKLLLA